MKDITSIGYEFYRNGAASTVAGHLAPVLRIGVYDPVSGKASMLIWEPAYNGYGAGVPTDSWVPVDALNGNFWMRAFGAPSCTYEVYDITLQEWVSGTNDGNPIGPVNGCTPNPVGPSAWVYSINTGIGSGWDGTFDGASDTVTLGFNGVSTTYNFEQDMTTPVRLRSWGHLKTLYR